MLEICLKCAISCPSFVNGECSAKVQGHLHTEPLVQCLDRPNEKMMCQTCTKPWEPNWLGLGRTFQKRSYRSYYLCMPLQRCGWHHGLQCLLRVSAPPPGLPTVLSEGPTPAALHFLLNVLFPICAGLGDQRNQGLRQFSLTVHNMLNRHYLI